MDYVILFIFGLLIGSFFNVVALRYDGDHFLLDPKMIGGRSHCPHCKKTLRWYELIPLVSFIIQRARCRNCGARIGFQYPLVELLSALIFTFVPFRLLSTNPHFSFSNPLFIGFVIIWIAALEIILLLSYIDILLGIIPDELNIALLVVGLIEVYFLAIHFGPANASFFGNYAVIFGLQGNVWLNHIVGAVFGVLFFGALVAVTRGKGMGMGDVKLALPLGLLFGWPDILLITIFAFIIGAIVGVLYMAAGEKTMKSALPFAPFLAVAGVIAFFFGSSLAGAYFRVLGL